MTHNLREAYPKSRLEQIVAELSQLSHERSEHVVAVCMEGTC